MVVGVRCFVLRCFTKTPGAQTRGLNFMHFASPRPGTTVPPLATLAVISFVLFFSFHSLIALCWHTSPMTLAS